MSSERCNSTKSSLICSSHVSLGLPLPLLPSTVRVSTTLTGAVVSLRFTCPNHLNLPSLIFSDILATPNHATSILRACVFLIAQQSVPYRLAGLTATL
ncbi:hypothetical protein Hanom_Chr12g01102991 [Helianthus anomalus]